MHNCNDDLDSNNNTYFILNEKSKILKQGCHDAACFGQSIYVASESNMTEEIVATEAGLAKLYVRWNTYVLSKALIDGKLVLFHFDHGTGVWNNDKNGMTTIKSIEGEFLPVLEEKLAQEFEELDFTDKKQLSNYAHRKSQVAKLQSLSFVKSVVEWIKIFSHRPDVELDSNPFILVTPSRGAWNFLTGQIGGTKPTDYITDSQCLGVKYEDADPTKMEFLKKELLMKIHPNEEDRKAWLTYECSSLKGGSSERFILVNRGTG